MAYAVPVLRESELHTLQEGEALRGGNIALIAAGTGLGEALLHNVDGRFIPSPSEGGHADFAARTEREIALLRDADRSATAAPTSNTSSRARASSTSIRSRTAATVRGRRGPRRSRRAGGDLAAALERRCPGCVETLDMFVEAYGAEAGNLALRTVSTGGVFVGGGIAPKILPALTDGRFMRAFRAKPPLDAMLAAMPVKVILNAEAGLLGAAVFAASGRVKVLMRNFVH